MNLVTLIICDETVVMGLWRGKTISIMWSISA